MFHYFSQKQRPQVRMLLDSANGFKPSVYIATGHHTSTTGPPVCGKKFLQIPWDLTYQAFVLTSEQVTLLRSCRDPGVLYPRTPYILLDSTLVLQSVVITMMWSREANAPRS